MQEAFGVQGISILTELPGFHWIWSFALDIMHVCLMNVPKTLVSNVIAKESPSSTNRNSTRAAVNNNTDNNNNNNNNHNTRNATAQRRQTPVKF